MHMPIFITSDHAGVDLKKYLINSLDESFYDLGPFSGEPVDYPDYAHELAKSLLNYGAPALGIAICGTGNGMSMCLNKHIGIRAGIAWNKEVAHLIAEHNKANVLVLPARFISPSEALLCVTEWLSVQRFGKPTEERHLNRISKIERF